MIIQNPILTGSVALNGLNLTATNLATTSSNSFTSDQSITGSLGISANTTIAGTLTVTGSIVGLATSASYVLNAVSSSKAVSASYSDTASFANSFNVAGNLTASNAVLSGTLTAQTLVVQTITSSVDFVTGSTRFGSLLTNTHTFTGSIYQTGSIAAFAGSVGIGTTNPSVPLEVYLAGGGPTVRITNSGTGVGTGNGFHIGSDISSPYNASLVQNEVASIAFYTNDGSSVAERMRITASGSVGVAVTPSTWDNTTFKGIQIAPSNAFIVGRVDNVANQLQVGSNAYYNADGNWKFIQNGYATRYLQNGGTHAWDCSDASGTAGNNVTFITPLTIASTGAATFSSTILTGGDITVSKSGDSGINLNSTTTNGVAVIRYKTTAAGNLWGTGINITAGDSRWEVYNFTLGASPFRISNAGAATFSSSVTATDILTINGSSSGKVLKLNSKDNLGDNYIEFNQNDGTRQGYIGYGYSGYNYMEIYQSANEPIIFSTNATERMRITAGGVLFVGATSITNSGSTMNVIGTSTSLPLSRFFVNAVSSQSYPCIRCDKYDATNGTSQVFIDFTVNNQASGNGSITGNGASQVTFTTWSDIRLKENITNLPSQLSNIMALRPVEFDYKNGSGHQIGFIAQEVQEIYPDIVGENAEGYLTISGLSKMESRLIKAIQELKAEIDELKNK